MVDDADRGPAADRPAEGVAEPADAAFDVAPELFGVDDARAVDPTGDARTAGRLDDTAL
ncbi:hypothetical protein [Halosimplex halophilum]|uniref:hypothetical protein n=1 Tax=Halosimplex halophilum TaxID=2559572 RepID=UPI001435612E|nr:hypothetical protein [Halosimplex halophilum]